MNDPDEFLDDLASNAQLMARVIAAVRELIEEDPDVSDEELGWAGVDLATGSSVEVPDDLELEEVGARLRAVTEGAN